jgi:hypothetical protein
VTLLVLVVLLAILFGGLGLLVPVFWWVTAGLLLVGSAVGFSLRTSEDSRRYLM